MGLFAIYISKLIPLCFLHAWQVHSFVPLVGGFSAGFSPFLNGTNKKKLYLLRSGLFNNIVNCIFSFPNIWEWHINTRWDNLLNRYDVVIIYISNNVSIIWLLEFPWFTFWQWIGSHMSAIMELAKILFMAHYYRKCPWLLSLTQHSGQLSC